MNRETFWNIRSERYDKLYWSKDGSYLDCIVKASNFKKSDIVLDVGTGTGIIANAIMPHVKHVVGLDISDSMLSKGKWVGFSLIKWDISDLIFVNNIFDKVTARMVFHHVLDNLDKAIIRCYDLLKNNGSLIVAEGVPPSEEKDVVDWYSHMFSFKEKRLTLTETQLKDHLKRNDFKEIYSVRHIMEGFSVKNWLINSGLDKKRQIKILKLHREASSKIKELYNMKILKDDCLIDTQNVIVVGKKKVRER